jgi:hypothetical protein
MTDRLVLGGDQVSLADITVPFLSVLGMRDHIIPEPTSAPVMDLVGSADKHELRLDGGHIGLVVGRTAAKTTIPTIIGFLATAKRAATMTICDLTPADVDGLAAFFGALSEEDLTFIREDVHDRAVASRWLSTATS